MLKEHGGGTTSTVIQAVKLCGRVVSPSELHALLSEAGWDKKLNHLTVVLSILQRDWKSPVVSLGWGKYVYDRELARLPEEQREVVVQYMNSLDGDPYATAELFDKVRARIREVRGERETPEKRPEPEPVTPQLSGGGDEILQVLASDPSGAHFCQDTAGRLWFAVPAARLVPSAALHAPV